MGAKSPPSCVAFTHQFGCKSLRGLHARVASPQVSFVPFSFCKLFAFSFWDRLDSAERFVQKTFDFYLLFNFLFDLLFNFLFDFLCLLFDIYGWVWVSFSFIRFLSLSLSLSLSLLFVLGLSQMAGRFVRCSARKNFLTFQGLGRKDLGGNWLSEFVLIPSAGKNFLEFQGQGYKDLGGDWLSEGMVLLDAKGGKIHTTVRKQLLYLFQRKLEKRLVYVLFVVDAKLPWLKLHYRPSGTILAFDCLL
ncbi:uncharacterized protein LOC123909997 isoform X5 [Trifolium pratense]|uniref:uncharacterized protein LOC123909997 isoform X5 n=1 Tax=Trifolium pratense TaxID=57577 RepID=UPI001E694115|nr:uncharacterized protein LOC123909997 isoform X5 [Trifolium pratense]XP_045816965.1 uncharacterized protein LOC123909997 isoform X5 [Trifolium pratense]XP_045816966.1 uncharacterized protein LOC123909997 isoform X5 [Trifolium pratense]XP_045816967.1 uncharacterized protein LOC123909997 isoform X5 [Trifolium pratense]XP_045816968.1 uncharacterized protein LOC123909997 isoform X5 [Trifolium pratense]XP_045816969.1 uncharacterized protein LOC123909997 isoform X5 [Trifolium pratense]